MKNEIASDLKKEGYKILSRISQGGMGSVYRGEVMGSGEIVAIKCLSEEETQNGELRKRFLREARALVNLEHEGIVRGRSAGEAGNTLYLVMEYIQGPTVRDLLKENEPIEEPKTREITHQVARAISYAHREGFVHRDIKPSNIARTDQTVKLLDFGLAREQQNEQETLTKKGEWVGSPRYMSPEQAIADGTIDGRTDIYSLGITAYHMATGTVPFEGETYLATLSKHINETPPPPDQVHPEVSQKFSSVIKKMIRKHPEDRYGDTGELVEDLDRIKQGKKPKHAGDNRQEEVPYTGSGTVKSSDHAPVKNGNNRITHTLYGVFLFAILLTGGWLYASGWLTDRQSGQGNNGNSTAETEASSGVDLPGPVQKLINGKISPGGKPGHLAIAYDFSDETHFHDWNNGNKKAVHFDYRRDQIAWGPGGSLKFPLLFSPGVRLDVDATVQSGGHIGLSFENEDKTQGLLVVFPVSDDRDALLDHWYVDDGVQRETLDRAPSFSLSVDRTHDLFFEYTADAITCQVGGEEILHSDTGEIDMPVRPGFINREAEGTIDDIRISGRVNRDWIARQSKK